MHVFGPVRSSSNKPIIIQPDKRDIEGCAPFAGKHNHGCTRNTLSVIPTWVAPSFLTWEFPWRHRKWQPNPLPRHELHRGSVSQAAFSWHRPYSGHLSSLKKCSWLMCLRKCLRGMSLQLAKGATKGAPLVKRLKVDTFKWQFAQHCPLHLVHAFLPRLSEAQQNIAGGLQQKQRSNRQAAKKLNLLSRTPTKRPSSQPTDRPTAPRLQRLHPFHRHRALNWLLGRHLHRSLQGLQSQKPGPELGAAKS